MFTVADYALLCLYLAVLTWVGAKYYRKSSGSAEFFAGGRAMSWLPVAISVIAADTSVVTILGNPGYAYDRDLRLVFYVLAYSVAAWLVIPIFLPFYCRLNMYTAYEYLEQRFDVRVRIITSALFLFIRGAHVSIAIYAPAIILSLIQRDPSLHGGPADGRFHDDLYDAGRHSRRDLDRRHSIQHRGTGDPDDFHTDHQHRGGRPARDFANRQ